MFFFLIEYSRQEGVLVKFEKFSNLHQKEAQQKRFDLELDLNRKKIAHEVVILESASEESLRKSHRRYFDSLENFISSPTQTAF